MQRRTSTNAYGAAVQLTDTHEVFGLKNAHFLPWRALPSMVLQTQFNAASYVGALTANHAGVPRSQHRHCRTGAEHPGERRRIANATYGVYFADSLNLTHPICTLPDRDRVWRGRFNAAVVNSTDFNGGDLGGAHNFTHFNPAQAASPTN